MLEAMIAGLITMLLFGVIAYSMSGTRREEELSMSHLAVMENAARAIHILQRDIKQITYITGKPVDEFSFRISADGKAIAIRRTIEPSTDYAMPNQYLVVEYNLVPTGLATGGFYLRRQEKSFDGVEIATGGSTTTQIFKSFVLKDMNFLYLDGSAVTLSSAPVSKDKKLLTVYLDVISDTGKLPGWGPFKEKSMMVNTLIYIEPPERHFDFSWRNNFQAELPPGLEPVLAPVFSLEEMSPVPEPMISTGA